MRIEQRSDLFAPEHEDLRAQVRAFVDRELAPRAREWEEEGAFPREVFERVGALGLFGLLFGPHVGGSGPDPVAAAVAIEELTGCRSAGVAASLGAHRDLAMLYLDRFGTPEQHERWLRPGIAGDLIGALAVTEPDAGSDVASIATSARRDGDDWVLNGTKVFITNGAWADVVVVAAKTDPSAGHGGISLFVVETGTPGCLTRPMQMLGWRTGRTGELTFSDVRLPSGHLLGEEGRGFVYIMQNFAWERLAMALGAVAGAQRTYEHAKAYALDRSAFGRPVGKFQVWRHRFADMATRIEAARALTYRALRAYVDGENPIREVAMAKLYATETAFHVADECVQVHGGYGYMMEFEAQRAWRDARLGPIGGGTSQIMREIIGKTLGM